MALPWRECENIPTACVDGTTIFYNKEFVASLDNDELVGLTVHEILHPLLDHLTRLKQHFKLNQHVANCAADYELNRFMTQYNATAKEPIVLPPNALLDEKRFGTRAAESIFRELLEEFEQKQKELQGALDDLLDQIDDDSGDSDSDSDSGSGDSDSDSDSGSGDSDSGSGDSGSGDSDSGSGDSGSDSGSDSDSDSDSGSGGSNDDKKLEKTKPHMKPTWGDFEPAKDQKTAEEVQKKWRSLLQSCIQTARLKGDNSPFLSELENMVESPVDLESILSRYMDEFAISDESTNTDRRYLAYHDICIAGMDSEQHGTLVFVKDTSGSMSQPILEQCVSVVQSACDRLRFNRIVVIDADDGVRNVEEFTPFDDIPLKAVGNGGTDFRPAFEYIEEEIPEARAVVYMTDGYGAFPKYAPDTPVLWLTWGIDDYPFGDVLDLKSIA
jgi:predicted metal-dependent peptidase